MNRESQSSRDHRHEPRRAGHARRASIGVKLLIVAGVMNSLDGPPKLNEHTSKAFCLGLKQVPGLNHVFFIFHFLKTFVCKLWDPKASKSEKRPFEALASIVRSKLM